MRGEAVLEGVRNRSLSSSKHLTLVAALHVLKRASVAALLCIGATNQLCLCITPCFPSPRQVGAVVVGFDRYINYYKIQYATLCIRENPGCMFIATNRDAVTHLTDAQVGGQAGVRVLELGAFSTSIVCVLVFGV